MRDALHCGRMTRTASAGKTRYAHQRLPILVEKDEDGFYVAECPVFEGCYSQGRTLDEALKNIRKVIHLVLEEKDARDILASYQPREVGLHTIALR